MTATTDDRRAPRDEPSEDVVAGLFTRHVPGPGPAAVFAHGFVVSSRYFRPTLTALAGRCEAWAPDLPGFGRTPADVGPLDVTALADRLARWIEDADVAPPVVVVANSAGCQWAVELAWRRPELCSGLVLNGPTFDDAVRSPFQHLLRFARTSLHESTAQLPSLVRDYVDMGPRRAIRLARAVLADPIGNRLGSVTQPVVVVRGDHDHIAPADWCRRVADTVPDGTLETIPGAAHTVNFTHPQELADVILALRSRVS